ncbi:centromere-associated protein E isoform X2 [Heterodontus francisci]|uniref:centromere-associated protein E isoform X2 n=1 Tax=Heterodontus francisci TaxID=7792 RepID=UPI00355B0F89
MAEEGAVQVCVRVRPPNDRENSLQGGSTAEAPQIHWKADSQTISQISGARSFSFDRVFHAEETTQTVYNEVAHSIVRSITQGYNGTIFAYGQTSSGKTYTMMGNAGAPGLIPLAICNLFNVINDMSNSEFLLRVSYMEIYNESVSDLLAGPKRQPLEVREDMERTVYVANLTEELAVTYEDVMKWVQKGEKNRHYGETKMNEHSSRSHTIFRVIVESRDKNNEAVMVAHLNLVDLAGSERASQTGAEGVRLKEGCFINRSLFVLGQVIKKLSDGQAGGFLNYRDSKLTRILQNSLGGNARTLIICTITPIGFEETLSTLQFASTAKFMKNTPHVNEVLEDQAMLKRCRKEIMNLNNRLEELASETRVQAMEKAQLLSEKHILQMEHEQKIKNLTRMLVRVSPDDQEVKARRKRRVTWAPGKLRASLDSTTKMIKLDKVCQELDEDDDDDFDVDSDWSSKTISECSSAITTKRGGSCGSQIPSFEDSLYFNDQNRTNQNCSSSVLNDLSSRDELEKRISELEKQLETLNEEKEKKSRKQKDYASHIEKQLKDSIEVCELLYSKQFDAESLKMENDKQKEEIEELKQLLKERLENAKYFKMENEKQKNEIKELEKLRERFEDLKEKREIEEFEFLEKEAEKEEKAQQKHENAMLRELVQNSEIINQELEAELKTKTKRLKEQEQNLLDLQQQLEQLKEVSDSKVNLEMLTVQIKQLQKSLNDAEVVTRDAKKESSFLRSENLELKEEMNKMRVGYQQMEKDMRLYSSQLDTERSRYKEMQSDLQKELKSAFNENTKLMSFLDGKVPKDLLDRIHLEKDMVHLKQQLDKAEKEKISLQEESSLLSQYKSLPEKVDELTKQVLNLSEELNDVASERDNLLACREENVEQLTNLRGEMSAIEDRNRLHEVLVSLQSERDLQENLKTEQQNEMQCRVENLQKELDLYSTKFEQEEAKCAQLQHDIEDKERQVKEQEQQLKHELEKQKEMDDKYSEASENLKLLNEMKEQLVIKMQVLTKANEELTMSQSNSHQKKNCESHSSEKVALHQELMNLRTEREQLKCDLQDNIEMCIENQAELRSLHDEVKLHQNAEMKLQKRLAEMEHLVNEEKEKVQALSKELQEVISQHDLKSDIQELRVHICEEQSTEIQEKSFNKCIQQLEDEKSSIMKEKDDLQKILDSVKVQRDEMKSTLQGNTETSSKILEEKFNQQLQQLEDEKSSIVKERDDLQEILESVKVQRDEMKNTLQENTEKMYEQTEELHFVVSQRDMLLSEIEELKARVSKEQSSEILEEKFNQQLQQLEDENSSIVKERDDLQEILESVKVQRDEMKNTLQENTEKMQEQAEELHRVVSQHDLLLSEIEELRIRVSKEQKAEIQENEFNKHQQLEGEKSVIVKERDDLQEILESVKVQRDEMKNALQENTEKMYEQTEELHCVVSQRDMLLSEIEELKARVSKEQSSEILEEKFNQQLQQLEDENSSIAKEKDNLQEILESVKVQRDEMKNTLQENTEKMQEQTEELHCLISQRDVLLSEIEELRARDSKEQKAEIQKEFSQRLQQLEDEKLSIVKEKDNLQEVLESVKVQRDGMKCTLQENAEMIHERTEELHCVVSQRDLLLSEIEDLRARVSKEQSSEILEEKFNQQLQQLEDEKSSIVKERDDLQEILESVKVQRDEMKRALQENTERIQKQSEEICCLVSQRDMLHGEIEELRAHISMEKKTEIQEKEFNQRLQQLEDEKSAIVKEKDNLQEILESVKVQRDEMKRALQENTERIQKQSEEICCLVSQRDMLHGEIEELRAHISMEKKTEIQEKEFNQRLQQLEDEKSAIVKEKDNLQVILESVNVQKDEMKSTLQENTQMMKEQTEELHHVISQRDVLRNEIEELRTHVSKEQNTEFLEEKFNQRLRQVEDEKLTIVKEKEELQELLESVKSQRNEMMSTLEENTEAMQGQTEELHRVVSQHDLLLGEIEELKARVSKKQSTQILEEKFNQRLQQLEDEKSTIVKEKDDLQEVLESVKVQRDEMKSALQEDTEMLLKWTDELNHVKNHRDQLLIEVEQLKEEIEANVSKVQKMELLQQGSNDHLEREKLSILMEKDELKLQMDTIQKVLSEKVEMLMMEERRSKELKELATALEKQIVTLKEEKAQIESTNSETDAIEAEINKLSNYLQEKDLMLQNTIQSLFQLENEYKIGLANADQELSREGEAWKELLVRFSSEVPEGSTESTRIGKLQEENQKLYEKLLLWRSNFMRTLSTVPHRVKNYQKPISKCDISLAEEKKKNTQLLVQLQTLKKQVSDPAELELISEENAEIRRLSTLIANKENHLQNTQQSLLELKSKYQNFLTSSQNGLLSKAKALKNIMERISNESCTNILKTIEEIEYENQMLDQECLLQWKAVQSEAKFSESVRTGYVKYIRNSCDEMANEKKKNEELLLQIEAVRQDSFNKNGLDPLLAMENQKLFKKLKAADLLLQKMRIKIHELEIALTASQEAYKQQNDKVTELQTELSSKTLENKLEDLQTKLLKKDSQIKNFEETLEQLQARVDMGAQPFKEEMTELKNRFFALQMEKIKESKHFENQISSLKVSLEHKEELLRQMKETLRRNQQEQDTTITVENKNETYSADASLTCSTGSGIVQNAMVLLLNSEKAKLNRDLNQLKKENARLARIVSELKYENNKWKERAAKLEQKDRMPSKHRLMDENVQHTLTQNPDESVASQSQKECAAVPPRVEISTELFPPESKTTATRDEGALALEKMLPANSSKTSTFNMESQLWSLPRSKIFDNSQLGFTAAVSPQQKPKSDKNEHEDLWPKPSAADPECKIQ